MLVLVPVLFLDLDLDLDLFLGLGMHLLYAIDHEALGVQSMTMEDRHHQYQWHHIHILEVDMAHQLDTMGIRHRVQQHLCRTERTIDTMMRTIIEQDQHIMKDMDRERWLGQLEEG